MTTDPLSSTSPSFFASLQNSIVPRLALSSCDYISLSSANRIFLRLLNIRTNHKPKANNELRGAGWDVYKFWATSLLIMIGCGVVSGRLFLRKNRKRESERTPQNKPEISTASDEITSENLDSPTKEKADEANGRIITSRRLALKRNGERYAHIHNPQANCTTLYMLTNFSLDE